MNVRSEQTSRHPSNFFGYSVFLRFTPSHRVTHPDLTRSRGTDLFASAQDMSHDRQTLNELRIDREGKPRSKSPLVLVILLFLVGAGIVTVIWWLNHGKAPVVRTILVQQPGGGGGGTLLNGSGYVTARREATVSSKVTGKVIEVLVEEGMKVEAGQVLARLDSSNADKSLQLAEAQAESARKAQEETKANLEQAERELRRITQLAENKVASESELDRASAEAKSLQARLARQQSDVAVAEREVALWKQQLEDTIIRAPFSGVVTSKNAQPGEMISPMSSGGFTRTGICTIVDMSSLEIEVEVNESYISRVQSSQPVQATLDSYPDWHIPAKVIAIIPTADRQKATVKVRVGFDKLDPRILPDMSVKVAFQSAGEAKVTPRPITIPKSAVRQQDGRDVVWVVSDGRAERRAISIGPGRDEEVTVVAGLSGGEKVVVDPPDTLVAGRVTEAKR
jgi:HlyD family secretion protein